MKRRMLCLLLTLCLAATLMVFPTYADGVLSIQGADSVCSVQSYKFSFVLPEGYTDPTAGYEFEKIGSDITNLKGNDGVYTGTVEAEWYDKNEKSFNVVINAIDPNGKPVTASKTVTLVSGHTGAPAWRITPNRHEQVWDCCGTVIVPNEQHTFVNGLCKVCNAPDIENPSKFSDVKVGAYYFDAVKWAVDENVTTGMTENEFQPDGTCTRAQVVTFLWREAGKPTSNAKVTFTDVSKDAYYYEAVQWAVENKITNGISETTFDPDGACTRAQVVTFLWRANGSETVNGNSVFTDVPADAYYAKAVQWAVENEITNGMYENLFVPNGQCTRAQAVTFIFRAK